MSEDFYVDLPELRLRARWLGATDSADDEMPTLVFLHEGLGCIETWRDFPSRLCEATGCRGLVYDRAGYGRSTPWRQRPGPDYMDIEADVLLPALLKAARIEDVVLVGHSDGATIALSYASNDPPILRGIVSMAAHVVLEDVCVSAIRGLRENFAGGELRDRLARRHDDVDATFGGWSQAWLQPGFQPMDMDRRLPGVQVPVQALQGEDDLYGTELQLGLIAGKVSGYCETRLVPDCGHSMHIDQPDRVLAEAARFIVPLLLPG